MSDGFIYTKERKIIEKWLIFWGSSGFGRVKKAKIKSKISVYFLFIGFMFLEIELIYKKKGNADPSLNFLRLCCVNFILK